MRRFVALVALLPFLPVSPAVGASPAGQRDNFPARIDLPNGFFPEDLESGPGTSYFVGSLVDGAIWRGDLRTGSGAVLAPGAPGRVSVGIDYEAARNRLWVAGGGRVLTGTGDALIFGTGDVRVYDASSGALLATYQPPGVGLLNDVTVTPDAVYVTDSALPQLVVIPLRADGSLLPPSAATTFPVGGDMVRTPGFNLNGIVAKNGVLLVAHTSAGKLFRVDPATGIADEVDLGGANLCSPDGLELLGRTLYVVSNIDNRGTVLSLVPRLATGVVIGDLTDPGLDFPYGDRGRRPAVGGKPAVLDAARPGHALLDHTVAAPSMSARRRGGTRKVWGGDVHVPAARRPGAPRRRAPLCTSAPSRRP